MCGEHWMARKPADSPVWIIPACAGSTGPAASRRSLSRDHPRMCGEHGEHIMVGQSLTGSSPHVRGAPAGGAFIALAKRIIPACAGSTASRSRWSLRSRDHPRMCGEHTIKHLSEFLSEGSSPHVRGAHVTKTCKNLAHGIIPACAGSTFRISDGGPPARDHPRMCGEHV